MLKIGSAAPAFSLKNEKEKTIKLSDYKGSWLVLYFYPRDLTPGCTVEACDFTDNLSKYKKAGADVLGVSADTAKKHQTFIEKKSLKISLLADEDKKTIKAYKVWQKKKLYGKDFMGIVRTTFLIDPKGKIAHAWEKVKVKGHVDEVLEKLKTLK